MTRVDAPIVDGTDEGRVLIVPPTRADGVALGKLFAQRNIHCVVVPSLTGLAELLPGGVATVIVSEESLVADAEPLVRHLDRQPVWSDIPIVVLSPSGTETTALARLVSRLGNVSVVERPVRTTTLLSLVQSCLRARGKQYQMRAALEAEERSQREIRDAERRYRSLIENLADYAIFLIDREGRVGSWNDGAHAVLGYREEEVIGQSAIRLLDGAGTAPATAAEDLRVALAQGRCARTKDYIRKDGQQRVLEIVLTAVRSEAEGFLGYAAFLRDVTARENAERERERLLNAERAARSEAERAGKMKDEFLATLSHELRTPLSAILGWTQVLRRGGKVHGDVANGLGVIERNARAQAQIIEDLLDMSSIISGKVRLDVGEVDLAASIDAAINTIRPAAAAKDLRLQVILDGGPSLVTGDANRLQQVFWNLISNAVKFTPKGGRVYVTMRRVESHFDVEVADSGEGIEPAFLSQVFDRFRQSDASTTRRHGGLGLGLAIVKQLVELHGGTVSAHSEGRGMGSVFTVTLPVRSANTGLVEPALSPLPEGDPHASDARSVGMPSLDGIDVLVVDDELDSRALVKRILEDCSAHVVAVGSVSDALRALADFRPQLVVSDIGMPGEDGYAFIRRLRAGGPHASVPAIALTAYARVEDRVKAIDAGYQAHLAKPVEPVELVTMAARLASK